MLEYKIIFFENLCMDESFDGNYRMVIYYPDGRVYERNKGFANRYKLWSGKSQHRIASVTKLFAIMSILILQQNNKLRLSNTINTYGINIPFAHRITIKHLIMHNSGIFNAVNYYCDHDLEEVRHHIRDNIHNRCYNNPDFDTILKTINKNTYAKQAYNNLGSNIDSEGNRCFVPGTDYRYNNTGYMILGRIIEMITKSCPSVFIRKNILEPLGMFDTCFHGDRLYNPVDVYDSQGRMGYFNNFSKCGIHANMISTTDDMHIFLSNYHKLLTPRMTKIYQEIVQEYWYNNPFNIKIKNIEIFHTGSLDFPPYFNEGTPSETMVLLQKDGTQTIIFSNKRASNKSSIVDNYMEL